MPSSVSPDLIVYVSELVGAGFWILSAGIMEICDFAGFSRLISFVEDELSDIESELKLKSAVIRNMQTAPAIKPTVR